MSEHKYNLKRDPVDERDYKFTSVVPTASAALPKEVDLRKECPPVFNQGSLGSCTSQAGSAAVSMLLDDPVTNLSELYLYYMERYLEGTTNEDAGATMRSICKALNKFGICEEKFMPYDISKFKVPPSEEAHQDAAKRKVTAYRSLLNLNQIKECLAFKRQPVLLGMNVYSEFERMGADGKLALPGPNSYNYGGHAVLVVGYVDIKPNPFFTFLSKLIPWVKFPIGEGYLIVRNSWGPNWGDHGYFYMPYEYVTKCYAWDFWNME